jgi:hypothetical protein
MRAHLPATAGKHFQATWLEQIVFGLDALLRRHYTVIE